MGTERQLRDRSATAPDRAAAPPPRTLQGSMARVAGAIGNRELGRLLQRDPAAGAAPRHLPVTQFAVSPEEVTDAEAWLTWLAQRGIPAQPTVPVPDRYAEFLDNFSDAVWGAADAGRKRPLKEAKEFVHNLREIHDEILGTKDHRAFELATLALQRAEINTSKAEGDLAFGREGAFQMDVSQDLTQLHSMADEEISEAREMGYEIPEDLQGVASSSWARWEQARKGWRNGDASTTVHVTPTEEADLVSFRTASLQTINSMRERRAADLARYHQAEADALQAAAEKNLTELRAVMADQRRALFMAGQRGALEKLHDAAGDVVGIVNEMKDAAGIITKRVDQLNAIAERVSKSSTKLITLPDLPKGLTEAYGKIKSAHEKLGQVIELLGVIGPGKTQLDDGLRYLKGLDMSLDHFSAKLSNQNPFLKVYINGYLRPGIQNCVAQINKIAAITASQNRSILEYGTPGQMMAINWAVEPGGQPAYLFLAQVFKVGAMAAIDDSGWDYFQEHSGDLGAAVGEALPDDRRTLGGWAARNKLALWETFYGSVHPPR
jgi:hypothetical protein